MNEVIQEINNAIYQIFNIDIQSVEWDYKSLPEKWSKKEIVGHLIDSAIINLQRFVRCTFEENFKLIYEQVEWVEAQQYQQADIKELLILWRSLNQQIIRVLKNYPVNRLQAQCDNSKTSINLHTVEWLAADYADQLKHHLKQIY
jgi:hypothetical protein